MRRALVGLNAFITITFLAAFIYTFLGEAHLTAVAREFAVSKTADYSKPMVDLAEETSQSSVVTKLLSKSMEEAIAGEIAEYRDDPSAYISELVTKSPTERIKLPTNAATAKLTGWKNKVCEHYEKVLTRILNDLRIFTGTNLVAGVIALFLALRAKDDVAHVLVSLSGILCLATCLSIYLFLDTFSFYQYLFNWQMGWSYPTLVALLYLYFLAKVYRHRSQDH